ncbi:hypothetical protein L1276_000212 [Flavobacterium sp. HSC-32F16]|uniref:hypothetical protein n=1 Tax=Flavobacterium sp. HSC-32F16 TaxID=2910964 RepID=UPI0020A355D5|nr:hypothetical protein [Flavobacterium sp. HSC-32F16]MCP2025072.1 hypothetical protein [Flavobacterium sp. HSC-32F16]
MSRFYLKKIVFLVFLIVVFCSLQSCLVSRCKRPQITGYIYDFESHKPIENCKVGETISGNNGYFTLDEKRYRQFTFFGFEAPALSVYEKIEKEGYESQSIQFMNPFGGGARRGSLHNADTIYLKKIMIKTN